MTCTLGFRDKDVTKATIINPGANGTKAAAEFSFATEQSLFFQHKIRPMYFDNTNVYKADLANALEFYLKIPAGSNLLSGSGGRTFSIFSYHWKPGDPWVGPNPDGGNLTDSQMHGYGSMRIDPSGADAWIRVVMSTSAFEHSRANYHFYAARGVVEDLTFFGSLRQIQVVFFDNASGPTNLGIDEVRLITIPPTAHVCPSFTSGDVPAGGGDYEVPIELLNPTSSPRAYRTFVSSMLGIDRQTLETAMHDADDQNAQDALQSAVGADGGLWAVELFAADGSGKPSGPSILKDGLEITVPGKSAWKGVLVHHIKPEMLGSETPATYAGKTYNVKRDTLTTSVIFWDPKGETHSDASIVFTGSNADTNHPAPPGFPAQDLPPAGFRSTDVRADQVGGYFVSILRLK